MSQKKIAMKYGKSWFSIDVVATLPFELIAKVLNINAGITLLKNNNNTYFF